MSEHKQKGVAKASSGIVVGSGARHSLRVRLVGLICVSIIVLAGITAGILVVVHHHTQSTRDTAAQKAAAAAKKTVPPPPPNPDHVSAGKIFSTP